MCGVAVGAVCACGVCVWCVRACVATARLPQGYSGARSVQGGASQQWACVGGVRGRRTWAVCVACEARVGGAGQWLERVAVEQGAVRGSGARRARGAVRGSGAARSGAGRSVRSVVQCVVQCDAWCIAVNSNQ